MAGNMTLAGNSEFKSWVSQLKKDIRHAQVKAAIKVNTELLRLYWRMGADICEKQKSASWGDGWLKELSRELMAEFPDMKGLSYRNLQYIRQWYLFYNQGNIIVQQVVAQLQKGHGQQPVAQINEDVFFSVPWGHHLYIISQCKDPYNFDFLTLDGEYRERELEQGLTQNVTRFLLELGTGFAFVGSQVPLQVGGDTVYPDLLFYHLELRCYVVVEMKITKFKAEHLGQLGMYISAVNHIKKKPTDNPTIGLLICKTKNNVMAQYALESTNQPIGISEYQLSKLMPENIQSQLPTIEDIEATLSDIKETKD